MSALNTANVDRRPDAELHGELRARFLPAAQDSSGSPRTKPTATPHERDWVVRGMTPSGSYTADYQPDRINIWLDDHGVIAEAKIG